MIHFDPVTHTYTTDEGRVLMCVSDILRSNGISPDYSVVSKDKLEQSANFGTMVHSHFEICFKSDGTDDSADPYVMDFIDKYYHSLQECRSEVLVSCVGNAPLDYAGTADIICKRNGRWLVIDIKTTSQVHREAVTVQASLYAYAYAKAIGVPYDSFDIAVLHCRNNETRFIDLTPAREEDLEELLSCTKQGLPYSPERQIIPSDITEKVMAVQDAIAEHKAQLKALEADDAKLKDTLLQYMKDNGITKAEFGNVKITYVAPTTRKSIDTEKLKTYYAADYEACLKESPVNESIRITISRGKA